MKASRLIFVSLAAFAAVASAGAAVSASCSSRAACPQDCRAGTVSISNAVSSVVIETLGARIVSWKRHGREMLWMPKSDAVKSWRHGGVPLCWPRHGRKASLPGAPIHGIAWNTPFKILSRQLGDSVSSIELGCAYGNLALSYRIVLDDCLRFEMRTENKGSEPVKVVSALHPYFMVGDISKISVGEIAFSGLFDKGFSCSPGDEYLIDDRSSGRRIAVRADEARRFVVWNPWKKLESGEDPIVPSLDAGEFRNFVCVEPVSDSWDGAKPVPAGETHIFRATFRVD